MFGAPWGFSGHQTRAAKGLVNRYDYLYAEKVKRKVTIALYPNPSSSEHYFNYATATKTNHGLLNIIGNRLAKLPKKGKNIA